MASVRITSANLGRLESSLNNVGQVNLLKLRMKAGFAFFVLLSQK